MAQVFAFGETLYSEEMLRSASLDEVRNNTKGRDRGSRRLSPDLLHSELIGEARSMRDRLAAEEAGVARIGNLPVRTTREALSSPSSKPNQISPIGIGKPLTVEIAHIYTGDLNARRRHEAVLFSALKRIPEYAAAPRAISYHFPQGFLNERTNYASVAPTIPGTPLVYHSPGLTTRSVTIGFELVMDRFPDEFFDSVADLFGKVAGVPLFAPASTYLLAGSVVLKLASRIAEKLIDGSPNMSLTMALNVDRPGWEDTPPGHIILSEHDELIRLAESDKYRFSPSDGLVHADSNRPYDGGLPYLVVTIDGSPRSEYENFQPHMASAGILDRFLHAEAGGVTDLAFDIAEGANDLFHRSRAMDHISAMEQFDSESPEYKMRLKLAEAAVKNIRDDSLRPDLPGE